MALLKFNRGEFKSLPTTRTEGHVYITTDEKAMYVDISNSERIRIGQIITLSAQEWTNLQPPYSTEAFYYIGGDYNALLKWTGSAWVQINSTKAVQDQFTALGNKITSLDTHLGVTRDTNGSVTSSTIKTNVTNLLTTVGDENSGLVADVNTLETRVGTLEGTVGNSTSGLVKDVTALKANTVQKIKLTSETSARTPVNNQITLGDLAGLDKVSKSNIDTAFENRLKAMETGIGDNAAAIQGVKTTTYTKDDIDGKVKTINDNITTNTNGIKAINEKIGTAGIEKSTLTETIADNTSRVGGLETRMGTAEGAIIQLQTDVVAAKEQADKGVADAAKAQAKADEALARSGGTMTGDITMSAGKKIILNDAPSGDTHAANKKYVDDTVNSAKTTLQGAINDVNTVATRADELSKANLATLTNETTGLTATYAKAKQGIDNAKKAQDDVDALEGVVGAGFKGTTLTAKITAIEGVNTTQGTAITELQEKVKNVSKVMDFAGVVTAKPADGADGYHEGDVVVVINEDSGDNGKEFVYDGTKWYEFGNSDATIAALGELGERLDEVERAIETADTGILARLTAVEGVNADQNTSINTILSALTWGTF